MVEEVGEGWFFAGVEAGLEGGFWGGFGGGLLLLSGAFWGAGEQGGVGLGDLVGVPTVDGFLHDAAEAALGVALACGGFGVTAPGVVGGVLDEACADGVEVDVGGHGADDVDAGGFGFDLFAEVGFDEHALEAVHPEGALALVALVVPAAEAFFDFFDEAGEVAEAVFEAVEFRLDGGFVAEAAPFGEFGLELVDVGLAVEGAEVGEEALFAVGAVEAGDPGGAMGDGGEEVEVVAHDAEGEEVDAGEVCEAVEDAAEGFFFGGVEEEVAAAGAGHDVVEVGGEG
jgi:hypothetical protein